MAIYLAFAASLICSGDLFSTVATPAMFAIIVSAYILIVRKLEDIVVQLKRVLRCKTILKGNSASDITVGQHPTGVC